MTMRRLKILYVAQLAPESTTLMRLNALRSLNHEVVALDISYRPPQRNSLAGMVYRAAWSVGVPLDWSGQNEKLAAVALKVSPDVIWIDKGIHIAPQTLREIKSAHAHCLLVHYNPDDPFGGFGIGGWRTFLRAIPYYDAHIVPRRVNVAEYRIHGARRALHALPAWGYAEDIHVPQPLDLQCSKKYGADIGFVGSFEAERANMLRKMAQMGFGVRIVGPWPKEYLLPQIAHSPEQVFGNSYVQALRSFKIALGFLRKNNRDLHTSRSIEIPACGVFMLAERSEEHLDLFEEGKEAEFFDSADELADKAKFYLENHSVRERIALAGRERCERSKYGNTSRMQAMLEMVTG